MRRTRTNTKAGLLPVEGTSHPQQYVVTGNYMEPKLSDGDEVRINASAPISSGDMCVLWHKGEYILRRYYMTGRDTIELKVENPKSRIKPLKLSSGEYGIVGRVGGCLIKAR